MGSSENWLGFSLSNLHMPPESSSSHLFQAFNSTNPGGVVDRPEEDVGSALASGCPKLEDFLGTAAGGTTGGCQFTTTETSSTVSEHEILYDSELKTIAASFLRGFSHTQKTLPAPLRTPDPVTPKKAVDTFGQRTSIYRGVTRHRWTGRYEAHLWDNSCRREGQSRKGRQVYLGGYDKEEKAARAYDLAALKYWGPTTTTNFPVSNYEKELEEMKNMTRQEFVASLRRKSSGFSRGASIYRGVTRHHQHGRWQARIGRVAGNKDLYLGTFSTQEEAAEAYDIAAIKFRGLNAVTNFDISRYDVKSIASSNLPVGGVNGKSKTSSDSDGTRSDGRDALSVASPITFASPRPPPTSSLSFALPMKNDPSDYWSILGYQSPPMNNPKSQNNLNPTTLFQPSSFQGTTAFSMELSGTPTVTTANNGGFNVENTIPFATPITISSGNSSYEGSNLGNWVAPSLHSFQPAKPNISAFQTPIFGIE
ncbi:hypothetical protein NMG60_11005722 [Bertholletia excelsa]